MKLKIVNMKKFIRTTTIIVGIVTILLFIGLNSTYSKTEVKYKEEYIVDGDTLWTIAKREADKNIYWKSKDIRDIVQEIEEINNLENTNLRIGQKILIPTL